MTINIGIDLMGNDNKPEDILKGVIDFSKNLKKNIKFTFFATKTLYSKLKKYEKEYLIVYVDHYITMQEKPLIAIRRKKKSSIVEGICHLNENKIDAFISLGNTGALTAGSTMILNTLKSISRPALLALIPTKKKLCAVLDVGANIICTSKSLLEYAYLGFAFQKTINKTKPNVGILNIGAEQKKGTLHHQKAYEELLRVKNNFNFIGNIEGKDVFDGDADVLITDGFTGNIFLKALEGLTGFILDKFYQDISKKNINEIFYALKEIKKKLYYKESPGALLIGLKKIVIKCHGYSSIQGVNNAIINAISFVKNDIITSINSYL